MNTDQTPPRSRLDWLLEAVSAVALLASIGDVLFRWSLLPERIPTHFNAAGNPDGWGGKTMLLILLATTIAMAILLTVAETHQRLINIPVSADRDSPEVRRLLRTMVIALKAVIILVFGWISDITMRTALGQSSGLGELFLPVFLAATLGPIIWCLVKLRGLPAPGTPAAKY